MATLIEYGRTKLEYRLPRPMSDKEFEAYSGVKIYPGMEFILTGDWYEAESGSSAENVKFLMGAGFGFYGEDLYEKRIDGKIMPATVYTPDSNNKDFKMWGKLQNRISVAEAVQFLRTHGGYVGSMEPILDGRWHEVSAGANTYRPTFKEIGSNLNWAGLADKMVYARFPEDYDPNLGAGPTSNTISINLTTPRVSDREVDFVFLDIERVRVIIQESKACDMRPSSAFEISSLIEQVRKNESITL